MLLSNDFLLTVDHFYSDKEAEDEEVEEEEEEEESSDDDSETNKAKSESESNAVKVVCKNISRRVELAY